MDGAVSSRSEIRAFGPGKSAVGFIGLIVPHVLRLVVGADHRRLVVPVALGGALLVVAADTCARTLAAPAEIPVGIFTAVAGAPVFLIVLQRRLPGTPP